MKNKLGSSRDSDELSRLPAFATIVTPRCCARVMDPMRDLCGLPAVCRVPGDTWWTDAFYCSEHRAGEGLELSAPFALRRVHIDCAVYLGAAAHLAPLVQTEAVARLVAVVGSLGGQVDIQAVRTTVGRVTRWPPDPGAIGPRPRP